MTRWRLDLAYDGTGFSGWSAQPGRRTVEGELERWLTLILRPEVPVALTVAGRTDAGVHARGQVAHVDLPELENDPGGTRLAWRLRRVLPGDIQLRALTRAPDGFDARFSAVDRRYCYRLWDTASTPDPLCRVFVRPVSYALDV
ncbi:MAG: tRNA pseudouridine(38-40) synthase TruA, partial [Actinomycetia bacterium]|nr:tRNA pseudouridine(38-40) synthase TruA [Actinomycetes bacterium]